MPAFDRHPPPHHRERRAFDRPRAQGSDGQPRKIRIDEFVTEMRHVLERCTGLECVMLSACYSEQIAKRLHEAFPFLMVIYWQAKVRSRRFSQLLTHSRPFA